MTLPEPVGHGFLIYAETGNGGASTYERKEISVTGVDVYTSEQLKQAQRDALAEASELVRMEGFESLAIQLEQLIGEIK